MKSLKNEQGFTLVELMVVVAIIGILSAVAIPNFKRYQAKTKTSEAKLQLSAIYSALTSLQSDYDAFATCLADAGYTPPTSGSYYAYGFSAQVAAAEGIVTTNGGNCDGSAAFGDGSIHAQSYAFEAFKSVGGYTASIASIATMDTSNAKSDDAPAALDSPAVDGDGSYFVAGAIGGIDSDNNTDALASQWAINENKRLSEVNRGF